MKTIFFCTPILIHPKEQQNMFLLFCGFCPFFCHHNAHSAANDVTVKPVPNWPITQFKTIAIPYDATSCASMTRLIKL